MRNDYKILLKHCFSFGTLVGISLIVTSYLFYTNGQAISLNPKLSNVNYMLAICGIFIGVRKLRNEIMQGVMSYGQALVAGILIMAFAAFPFALYSYFMFSSDSELISNFIALMEKSLKDANWAESKIESYMEIYELFITPVIVAFIEFINKIFIGLLFSLFLAGILSRTNNLNIINKTGNLDENKNTN